MKFVEITMKIAAILVFIVGLSSIFFETELVTNGIYQISRNPAFLGFDLLYIGTLLMFFNWILCFLTVFAVIMYHLQIVLYFLQFRHRCCHFKSFFYLH